MGNPERASAALDTATAREKLRWPTWDVRDPVALARYIDGRHVEGLDLVPHELHHQRVEDIGDAGPDRYAAANRQIAVEVLARLAARNIPYRTAELAPDGTQRLQHPSQLRLAAASCVDLSIALAAACDRAGLAPLVLLGWPQLGAVGHAWVVIDLWRSPKNRSHADADLADLPADELAEELAEERYLGIDVSRVALAYDGQRLDADQRIESAIRGTEALAGSHQRDLAVVDVKVEHARLRDAHHGEVPTYDAPEDSQRPEIIEHLPPNPLFRNLGSDRRRILDQLSTGGRTFVLHGISGVGKSMLAIQAARNADSGYGWALNATDGPTLINELATVEARRTGFIRPDAVSSREDRLALAAGALARLHRSEQPWVVVVDNANGDPKTLRRWLPHPRADHGQTVIITTTNHAWLKLKADDDERALLDVTPLRVEPLAASAELPDDLDLAGLPLLIDAYERLAQHLDVSLDELARRVGQLHPTRLPAELSGADRASRALWELARDELAPPVRALGTAAAWGSPDRLDAVGVPEVANASDEDWGQLFRCGLVATAGTNHYRMHRRFGTAIRHAEHDRDATTTLTTLRALSTAGDLLDVEALNTQAGWLLDDDRWTDTTTNQERGCLLHDTAELLEPRIGPKSVAPLLAAATPLLADDDHHRRAGCLHALARLRYQPLNATLEDLEEARTMIQDATRLRAAAVEQAVDDQHRHQRRLEELATVAFEGLVLHKIARSRLNDPNLDASGIEAARALAQQASDIIDQSYLQRLALCDNDEQHPLVLRGRFNQAGPALGLAQIPQADADLRRDQLLIAEQTYRDVYTRRRELKSTPTAHLASCVHGLAIVNYYRAVLLPASHLRGDSTDPLLQDLTYLDDWELRAHHLRVAAHHLAEGLRLREQIAEDDRDDDVGKSISLDTKITLGRLIWRTADPGIETTIQFGGSLTKFELGLGNELRQLQGWATRS